MRRNCRLIVKLFPKLRVRCYCCTGNGFEDRSHTYRPHLELWMTISPAICRSKKMSQIKGLTGIGVYLWLCALSFGWRKKMVKIKG